MKKIVAAVLVAVMVLGLCACSISSKAIIGTWKNQTTVLGVVTETVYTFNEDGTGNLSNVVDMPFTYSFSDDKLLITMTVLGISTTEEYTYEFGVNKLTLTKGDETIVLEKAK